MLEDELHSHDLTRELPPTLVHLAEAPLANRLDNVIVIEAHGSIAPPLGFNTNLICQEIKTSRETKFKTIRLRLGRPRMEGWNSFVLYFQFP